MNIYRNKENNKLYYIEHLILDIRYLNHNANAGIYAYPYKWNSATLVFKSKNKELCEKYVQDNFEVVSKY